MARFPFRVFVRARAWQVIAFRVFARFGFFIGFLRGLCIMGKKLYVGNLPFSITEDRIGEVFSQIGQVESLRIVIDRDTGRSKGFGFVEMATDEQAAAAIEQLHGADLDGRALVVNEARPMEPRGPGGGEAP
jgi:hypothetical protein